MVIIVLFPKYFQSLFLACGRISTCTLEVRCGHVTCFGLWKLIHVTRMKVMWMRRNKCCFRPLTFGFLLGQLNLTYPDWYKWEMSSSVRCTWKLYNISYFWHLPVQAVEMVGDRKIEKRDNRKQNVPRYPAQVYSGHSGLKWGVLSLTSICLWYIAGCFP